MTEAASSPFPKIDKAAWRKAIAPYQKSDLRRSLWQVATSFIPFFVFWYLMYRSLEVSYLLTLLLAPITAGFVMRIFIIFHDCGHGSFFKSQKANDITGTIAGIIAFTPYYAWRHSHAVHHATSGDLDRRGIGDIWTLTKEEFEKLPRWQRFGYRVYRNPFIIFVVGPFLDFVVLQRFVSMNAATGSREKNSVIFTNLALLVLVIVMSLLIGVKALLLVQLPIIAIASSAGVYMFYVQHQYENTYWEHHEQWDFATAALYGSSYFKLPRILQWFSGNIGFHHIHHLSPRIPNYELERCHNENPMFQVEPMTIRTSLKSIWVRLWDEDRHKLVGYHDDLEGDEEQITTDNPAASLFGSAPLPEEA
jgi:omega-6 fatty acid desaturase (delta-12 desaturase)